MRIPIVLSIALLSAASAAALPAPANAAAPSCRLSGASGRLAGLNGNRMSIERVSCADANRVVRSYGRKRCTVRGGNTCTLMVDRVRRIWSCSSPTAGTATQTGTVVRCVEGPLSIRVRGS